MGFYLMNDQNVKLAAFWKRCSTCKKEIPFGGKYYVCSVSTCRHPRTGFYFCSAPCWDGHLGFARHRDAWAEDAVAPTKEAYLAEIGKVTEVDAARAPRRQVIKEPPPVVSAALKPAAAGALQFDTLVVVSKVKELIRNRSTFSTSQCCIDALSKRGADECLTGIESAKAAGRKTVMGRDIK